MTLAVFGYRQRDTAVPAARVGSVGRHGLVPSHHRRREGHRRHRECRECAGTSPSAGYLPLRGRADVDRWSAVLAERCRCGDLAPPNGVAPHRGLCGIRRPSSATDATDGASNRQAPTNWPKLGRVLDDLAQRRRAQDPYDRNQLELLGGLQTAGSEHEARDLLRRHLERMVSDSKFTILSRYNSADRLQALAPLGSASPPFSPDSNRPSCVPASRCDKPARTPRRPVSSPCSPAQHVRAAPVQPPAHR
ncbi:MAG: hypothetical protein QOE89_1647 [Pseudonocardiales bacterium]|nr:hypothetical protein [Pseudonocardiales bacterium]